MPAEFGKIAVIGAGAWGTALSSHLARAGHEVTIWAYEEEVAAAINSNHENDVFLAGYELAPQLAATNSLAQALEGAAMVVMVVPTHVFRHVLSQAADFFSSDAVFVSCSKGIEADTGFTMCEVAADVLPKDYHRRLTCLSGPSFAKEVVVGVPTVVTVACRAAKTATLVQKAFSNQRFRVYTSPDLVGVELGGAVKNPLAIGAGMVSGLGLGHNTLSAMITRGLVEMNRLAQARGGQVATITGLSGLGDLVLTCTGDASRNRNVGMRLGKGESIDEITSSTRMVAEGVHNTKTVLALAKEAGVEMPIIQSVYNVIYEGMNPLQALDVLMTRELKSEY